MEAKPYVHRVYLDDTDAQGIVYHANYLKFFERARSDLLAAKGVSIDEQGRGAHRFVVHEVHMKYLRSALLGDDIQVMTRYEKASEFRLTFWQEVRRGETKLVEAETQVVCIDPDGNLTPLPDRLNLDDQSSNS
ncbi:MAG: YbgC/FadM family acyl-CoA thioesterase [Deltaproteobacteria bacterium]|nr:YbgC/FadM family acyl-CoA thioesterase [Deltaproteobacteria bacterium]